MFRKAERRNDYLYKYTKADALPETDTGTTSGCSLQDCTTCIKSGECHLQELAHRMGVHEIRFENVREIQPIDTSSHAIIRDPNKCILCGDCVRMCDNVQNINAIDFAYRGTDAQVIPAFNKKIAETDCVGCGQCRVVCPTGAISIHTNIDEVWEALADKNTKVIAQIAPAVRVAIGDNFGYAKGENVMGKLVGVLHRLGFDEVYDTSLWRRPDSCGGIQRVY